MKYGRRDIEKKQQNMMAAKIEQKAGMTLLRLFLIALFALVIVAACAGYSISQGLIASAPDISELSTAPVEAATYIYSADGRQLQKLTAPTSNRTPVSIDQVPLDLQHAIVAIEDERFYEHNGIDVRGIIRAFIVGVTGGSFSEGASTITQQLLKNSVFPDWVSESSLTESFKRKFQEQYLALELEKKMEETASKEEVKQKILEDYLNTINLGAGTYGVQAAALFQQRCIPADPLGVCGDRRHYPESFRIQSHYVSGCQRFPQAESPFRHAATGLYYARTI